MPDTNALISELANELATWPGVKIERRSPTELVAVYERNELGVLHADTGIVELPFAGAEHDDLVEHGDAEPDVESAGVSHDVRGPSDVTETLALFDQRYRDLRGDTEPRSSADS
jgi:hypothetical protein